MQHPTWVSSDNQFLLVNNGEVLVSLTRQLSGPHYFTMGARQFEIRQGGFWQPIYVVYGKGEEVVRFTHNFWGSKGKIVFADGTEYQAAYENGNGVALKFLDGDHEVLSCSTAWEQNKWVSHISLGIALEDAENLLILAALGKTIFSAIDILGSGMDDGTVPSLLLNH